MLPAICVVGYKNSGKTTVCAELCAELARRGLKVGGVKFAHDGLNLPEDRDQQPKQNPFDKQGTDTARMGEACVAVAGLSATRTALFYHGGRYLADMLPLLTGPKGEPIDVLVVEGGKALTWLPRVVVPRPLDDHPGDLAELGNGLAIASAGRVAAPASADLPHAATAAELADIVLARGFSLPGLDCSACGYEDCLGLARAVVTAKGAAEGAKPEDCEASGQAFNLTVNGVEVGMNPFVRDILAAGLKAQLAQLKGVAPGRAVIELDLS